MMEDFNTLPNVKESGTAPIKLSIRIMARKDQKETSMQIYDTDGMDIFKEERIYAGTELIVYIRVLEQSINKF